MQPTDPTPTPPPVLLAEGFDGHVPVLTDVECPQCDGGRCDCLGKQVKICNWDDEDWPCSHVRAFERGIAEGRRQATEGCAYTEADERRVGDALEDYYRRMGLPPSMRPYAVARIALDAATAGGRRLVGPWETAEQPEPDGGAR